MCRHENVLWPTPVSHSFSFLKNSLDPARGKHYQKIIIPSLDLFLKISLFQVAFLTFFAIQLFLPTFLGIELLLQYVAPFQASELVKFYKGYKLHYYLAWESPFDFAFELLRNIALFLIDKNG